MSHIEKMLETCPTDRQTDKNHDKCPHLANSYRLRQTKRQESAAPSACSWTILLHSSRSCFGDETRGEKSGVGFVFVHMVSTTHKI